MSLGLRRAAANTLSLTGVGMIDRVFIASIFEQKYGKTTFFNDSASINTVGNFYPNVDLLITSILSGAAMNAAAPVTTTTTTIASSPSPIARLLRNTTAFLDNHNNHRRRRRLDLTFFTKNSTQPPDPSSQRVIIRFNVLFNSVSAAKTALAAAKKKADDEAATAAGLAIAAAAAAAANTRRAAVDDLATSSPTTATSSSSSSILSTFISLGGPDAINATGSSDFDNAVVVELTYTKSYYALFLEWLQRNILAVLCGTAAVIVLFFCIFFVKHRLDFIVKDNKLKLRQIALKTLDDGVEKRRLQLKLARRRHGMQLLSVFMKASRLFLEGGEGGMAHLRAAMHKNVPSSSHQAGEDVTSPLRYSVPSRRRGDVDPPLQLFSSENNEEEIENVRAFRGGLSMDTNLNITDNATAAAALSPIIEKENDGDIVGGGGGGGSSVEVREGNVINAIQRDSPPPIQPSPWQQVYNFSTSTGPISTSPLAALVASSGLIGFGSPMSSSSPPQQVVVRERSHLRRPQVLNKRNYTIAEASLSASYSMTMTTSIQQQQQQQQSTMSLPTHRPSILLPPSPQIAQLPNLRPDSFLPLRRALSPTASSVLSPQSALPQYYSPPSLSMHQGGGGGGGGQNSALSSSVSPVLRVDRESGLGSSRWSVKRGPTKPQAQSGTLY